MRSAEWVGKLASKNDNWLQALDRPRASNLTQILLLGFIAGLSLAGYLIYSNSLFRPGFPLDDAWIHQTYARNLAQSGQMAFIPGQPSAGSTSPAWTFLLMAGYLLHINSLVWAYFLGWLLLWGTAVIAWAGFGLYGFSSRSWALAAGLMIALEWHLVWASGSGMETLLQADIILLVLVILTWLEAAERRSQVIARSGWAWMLVGSLVGMSIWVRPDGLTLLGLVGWVVIFGAWSARRKLRIGMFFIAGFGLLMAAYLWFNWRLAGDVLPNTFYAKQAEYAILRLFPLWQRVLAEFRLPLVGIGILLLPGLIIFVIACLKRRDWAGLGGLLWLVGYLGLYALRLPVTYQHGRYVIPAMPVFFLYGLVGLRVWFEATQSVPKFRLMNRVWLLACVVTLLAFWITGGRSYSWDVAVIESEMVATARWVSQKTEIDARLAAHDIGALGYFSGREIVDLAGLVSPEVIPMIRDESALGEYLEQSDIQYLVTFPGWYPYLVSQGSSVYTTFGPFSPQIGGENMMVYRWFPSESGN